MAKKLTDRQRSVLVRIGEGLRDHNYPPTLREIGEEEGIRSTNGVRSVLEALEKKGYITRKRYQSRAIELTDRGKDEVVQVLGTDNSDEPYMDESGAAARTISLNATVDEARNVVTIPVLGRVAAGLPLLAEQNIDEHVALDAEYAPHGETFALRVKGESMIEEGIHNGDVVFCRVQENAEPGEIVVALIGDEATVKYYYPEKNRVVLKPANQYFGPIVVEADTPGFRILGKVVGLYRRYMK